MSDFAANVRNKLDDLQVVIDGLRAAVQGTDARSSPYSRSQLDAITEALARVEEALPPILRSFNLIEVTGLDIVDMQQRLEGETARLASALRDLDHEIYQVTAETNPYREHLVLLDEAAQDVAGAVFPGAVSGLRDANVKLWSFTKVAWAQYQHSLAEVVRKGTLSRTQEQLLGDTFDGIRRSFDDVNELLNELARSDLLGATTLTRRFAHARESLQSIQREVRKRKEQATFKGFGAILDRARKVARDTDKKLDRLEIPVFPRHSQLEELKGTVEAASYEEYTGLGRFALLNIASRMRSIRWSGGNLLSPALGIRVFRAFPDRIYFAADARLLDVVDELQQAGKFAAAPASLHKFNHGSTKQGASAEGNLQMSWSRPRNGTINVDADIDLYRDPVLHLFGEVFVNHLTGSKTDQFKVREMLDKQDVRPIGGFHVSSGAELT